MIVKEMIDILRGYPDTMEVLVYNETGEIDKSVIVEVNEVTEDTEIPNTVIIKI